MNGDNHKLMAISNAYHVGARLAGGCCDRMNFASHLRTQRLGEFTIGSDLQRSEPLALTQLFLLYHLVTARAVVAPGGHSARSGGQHAAEPDRPAIASSQRLPVKTGEPGPGTEQKAALSEERSTLPLLSHNPSCGRSTESGHASERRI